MPGSWRSISTRSGCSSLATPDAVLAGGGLDDPVARVLEHVPDQLEVEGVVLDHEDRAGRSRETLGRRRSRHGPQHQARAPERGQQALAADRLGEVGRRAQRAGRAPARRRSRPRTTGTSAVAGSAFSSRSTSQPSILGSRMSSTTTAGTMRRPGPAPPRRRGRGRRRRRCRRGRRSTRSSDARSSSTQQHRGRRVAGARTVGGAGDPVHRQREAERAAGPDRRCPATAGRRRARRSVWSA